MGMGIEWVMPIVLGLPTWVLFRGLILGIRRFKSIKIDINKEIMVNLFALYLILLMVLMLVPMTFLRNIG